MSLLRAAVVLAPLLAAALVRWRLARSAGLRGSRRLLLWFPVAGSAVVAVGSPLSPGRRAAALGGGVAASYLALVAVTFAVMVAVGEPSWTRYVVAGVAPGSPADGRLATGDRLIALDGAPLRADEGPPLSRRIGDGEGRPVRLTLARGDREMEIDVTPQPMERGLYRIGIELQEELVFERAGAVAALGRAAVLPARMGAHSLAGLWDVLTAPAAEEGVLYGPVGISTALARLPDERVAVARSVEVSVWIATLVAIADLPLLVVIALVALRRRRAR